LHRRGFLRFLLSVFSLTALGSFLYPISRFIAPPLASKFTSKLSIEKDLIPVGGAKEIVLGNAPAIIINVPDKGYVAVSRVCTHLGCLVQYDKKEKRLLCPCHAGVFDLEGKVLSGPPPKPLETIPLKVEGGILLIG
jgi:cytochrome b6-f complex iron-sulfur subunit